MLLIENYTLLIDKNQAQKMFSITFNQQPHLKCFISLRQGGMYSLIFLKLKMKRNFKKRTSKNRLDRQKCVGFQKTQKGLNHSKSRVGQFFVFKFNMLRVDRLCARFG